MPVTAEEIIRIMEGSISREVAHVYQEDTFIHCAKHVEDTGGVGWKLHISVDETDLLKAVEYAAPIISQYCHFKVRVPEQVLEEKKSDKKQEVVRTISNAQFTVYLESETGSIEPEKVKNLLAAVSRALAERGIREARQLPNSDAPIKGYGYFSVRNDRICIFYDRGVLKSAYLPATLAHGIVNPSNSINPYAGIFSIENISPLEVFEKIDLQASSDHESIQKSVRMLKTRLVFSLISYVNQYSKYDCLREFDEILDSCMVGTLSGSFIKEEFRAKGNVKNGVMHAVRILSFLQLGSPLYDDPALEIHFKQELVPVFYKYIEAGREFLEPELAKFLAAFDKHLEKEVEKWMPSFDENLKEEIRKKNTGVRGAMEFLFCHPDGSDWCYIWLHGQMELVKQRFLEEASLESSPPVTDAKSETKREYPLQKSPASTHSGFFEANPSDLHSKPSAALNAKPLSISSEGAVSHGLPDSNSSFGATDNGGQKEDSDKEGPGNSG